VKKIEMDIQTRKITFIQQFLQIQSEEIIIHLEKFLEKEIKKKSEEHIIPMTLNELNKRIDKSIDDSKNERMTESKQLLKEMQKWD
jgi:hypothetical protein